MPTPLEALSTACDFFREQGGQLALAAAIGVKSPSISGWRKALAEGNAKGIPQDRCEPIETATGGRVRVEELRPDLLWKRDPEGHVIGVITPIKPTSRKRGRRRATAS
jgi:DNA-binding transcriptional regulator YdaS (Cro superfamily)